MKSIRLALTVLFLSMIAPSLPAQVTPTPDASIQKKIDEYLRHLYAFGSDVKLVVGPLKESGVPGLLETNVDLTLGDNQQTATMYVSKDGRYLIRGEIADLTKDPLAEIRSKLQTDNAPSVGPVDAKVTIVEFADFECPVCRQLHDALEQILPNRPQVRLIFKDYPIEQIHPWARTAALAGRCAYDQDPKAFWKIYDALYNNQDIISAENVWDEVVGFAGNAGLNTDTFKACLASPEAAAAVDASVKNAKLLDVTSTPTLFINGRRVVGADANTIMKYITFDLPSEKGKNQ
ncbi:MAG TPA: thioredoxin domain-containing protein [Candidatus Acidoferrum sp.]|nr:thioredoxin domain-containing protein [Candidatus Acidoferrum sp.]